MNALTRLMTLCAICLLAGCWVLELEDVSSREDLRGFMGATITLHQDMEAIGVTLDQNYRTGVDVIHLVPRPGFSGPEVKARVSIPAGVELKVTGAVAHAGLIPRESIYFVVTGPTCSFCQGKRILVDASIVDGKPQLPNL